MSQHVKRELHDSIKRKARSTQRETNNRSYTPTDSSILTKIYFDFFFIKVLVKKKLNSLVVMVFSFDEMLVI